MSNTGSNGSRKTLSLKEKQPELPAENEFNKVAEEVSENQGLKHLVSEILIDTFMVRKDKEGSVKPARCTKVNLKHLCTLEDIQPIGADQTQLIVESASSTDQGLDCLTEIFLALNNVGYSESQQRLLRYCIRLASGIWIYKHEGTFNLFEDIFDNHSDESKADPIKYLHESLSKKYKKRLSGLSKVITEPTAQLSENDSQPNAPEALAQVGKPSLNRTVLERQKRNLLIMGSFWLLGKEKVSHPDTEKFMLRLATAIPSDRLKLKEVSLFLAHQCLNPTKPVLKTLSDAQDEINKATERNNQLTKQIFGRDQQIAALSKKSDSQINDLNEAQTKIESLNADINSLNQSMTDMDLTERAKRTHLRDNEGQIRSKAYNLLSDEVLGPLQLSMSALNRDKPKLEMAMHQIELAVESIERELKWFKE